MKRSNWILLGAVLCCAPGWAAVFVYPRTDCVVIDYGQYGSNPLWRDLFNNQNIAGQGYAQFGYLSFQAADVSIPQGSNNIFVYDPQFRNQPTVYHPGIQQNVFATLFDPSIGMSWFLNGAFATADTSMPACPGMSAAGGPLPPQFAPLGVASGQTVRLTVSANRVSDCSATLSFVDTIGNPIGPPPATVTAHYGGQSAILDLVGSSVTTPGHRLQVQPRFAGTYRSCQSSVEVFSSSTGVTAATNRPIQPFYQYDFDPQGLSAGQTLRVNISAPPGQFCGASLSFVDASGNPLGQTSNFGLPAGTAAYIELPSTSVPGLTGWSGGHVPVRPILNPLPSQINNQQLGLVVNNVLVDETCFASSEIFDTLTGYTRSLANPQPVQ